MPQKKKPTIKELNAKVDNIAAFLINRINPLLQNYGEVLQDIIKVMNGEPVDSQERTKSGLIVPKGSLKEPKDDRQDKESSK